MIKDKQAVIRLGEEALCPSPEMTFLTQAKLILECAEKLRKAFPWDYTTQGGRYWKNIHTELMNMANDLIVEAAKHPEQAPEGTTIN